MELAEIEELIVELLAQEAHCSPAELRARLSVGGDALPVDSLLAAEVLALVQDRVGVVLPADAETAQALRSVRTFAEAVARLIPETSSQRVPA